MAAIIESAQSNTVNPFHRKGGESALRKTLFKMLGPAKQNARYADAADLLRVLCTLLVAAYHIWQQSWLNPAFSVAGIRVDLRDQVATGYLGVELLLMLSGFLLYLPYASGKTPSIGSFYKKRALRILPSYWFCILVMLFAFALPQGQYASAGAMWKDLAAHATFTHNLFRETYFATPLNGAMWTLAVEAQFYLIAPLLCRAFRRRPAAVYAAMLLVSQAYRHLFVLPLSDTTYFLNRLPNLLEVYANGMLAAHVYVQLCRRRQSALSAWISTLLAAAALTALWFLAEAQGHVSGYELSRLGQMLRRFLVSACGAIFLICGSRGAGWFRALCSNRLIRFLSGISLNFYIWHQVLAVKLKAWHIPPYSAANPNAAGEQPWQTAYTIACFAAALIAATLTTYLIERPAAKLGARLLSRSHKAKRRR